MPHYKDGTKAQVGDVVRGKGYNIKDAEGNLKEIVGTLLTVNPNATSCSCTISVTQIVKELDMAEFKWPDYNYFAGTAKEGHQIISDCDRSKIVIVRHNTEYGQCDHFELVHRVTEPAAV